MVQATAPDFTGIVVAAGRSARLGGPIPKQFLEIGGRLIVERSVDGLAVSADVGEVVVVVAPEQLNGEFAARLQAHPRIGAIVAGGETRAASVAAGLAAVPA